MRSAAEEQIYQWQKALNYWGLGPIQQNRLLRTIAEMESECRSFWGDHARTYRLSKWTIGPGPQAASTEARLHLGINRIRERFPAQVDRKNFNEATRIIEAITAEIQALRPVDEVRAAEMAAV